MIQANLKEIGIECTIESMDLATYLSVTTEGDYEAPSAAIPPATC